MSSGRNRATLSARKTNLRKGSWLSKVPLSGGRESELYYFLDDASMDEEPDFSSSHRCSMVRRYHLPTFFTPEKS